MARGMSGSARHCLYVVFQGVEFLNEQPDLKICLFLVLLDDDGRVVAAEAE